MWLLIPALFIVASMGNITVQQCGGWLLEFYPFFTSDILKGFLRLWHIKNMSC